MRRVLAFLCLGALLAVAWPVQAHTVDQPLEVETQLMEDEGEDAFYWFDGYDLWTLFAREAHVENASHSGLVFRFKLYGGFAPTEAATELSVDLGLDAGNRSRTWGLTTTDDEVWDGNMTVLDVDVRQEDPPWTGVTSTIRAFVSYAEIGAGPGEDVSGFRMASWADDRLLDVAPGGWYPPVPGGTGEIPSDGGRTTDELTLQGPVGYVDVSPSADGRNVTLEVENALDSQGQHVVVRPRPAAGWSFTPLGRLVASVGPGNATTFRFRAEPTSEVTEPLAVEIATDVGGLETYYVGVNGAGLWIDASPAGDLVPPQPAAGEATPGPSLIAVVVTTGLAAWVLRRR